MTITTNPSGVPLPVGGKFGDDCQNHPDTPYRVIVGHDRGVPCRDGDELIVSTSCIQFTDGAASTAASCLGGGPNSGTAGGPRGNPTNSGRQRGATH